MTVRKLSVALDDGVAAAAATAARRAGVSLSAWLNHAAENELALQAGLEAVAAWEADNGAFTTVELATADEVLDRVTAPTGRRVG